MFLDNKYTRLYYKIIEAAKLREKPGVYCEKHHIIPRSFGGDDTPENLVLLTGREHYLVHVLLCKMTAGIQLMKMSFALSFFNTGAVKERAMPKSRWYEYSRALLSETQTGKVLTAEHKERVSKGGIARFAKPEERAKIGNANRNPSQETRGLIGHAASNRPAESIQKMRDAKSKPCTIDDIRIFNSRKELGTILGWGKSGAASPTFKYL